MKVINLKLRSQVWRGIPWDHTLQVCLPENVRRPRTALLFITGGEPTVEQSLLEVSLADRLGAPVAVLFNVPNQPLFDGKSEDDLIAHTFEEYLGSGDESWPLLFPMVKSAVKAMDAVQELSRKEWAHPVEEFVVTGASKRGWTTYLTGATDRRVRAIAPMVFDNLRFAAQMPRQLSLWGRYSEQIDDYSRRGLQQQMDSERGQKLVSLVDPWFYRKQLGMPKLLIHGANDRYWATDATRLYWDDLPGEKHLLAVPNAGHGLSDRARVHNTLTAFFQAIADRRPFPTLTGKMREHEGHAGLQVTSSASPTEVRLWSTRAPDLDFRPTEWRSVPLNAHGNKYEALIEIPSAGGLAAFGEAEYVSPDGETFTLSTPPAVYGKLGP